MKIAVNKYGRLQDSDLCEICLENDRGMRAKILNYGATLEEVLLPFADGQARNVVMSLRRPADYSRERNFLGGTVGRVVGRIKQGRWNTESKLIQLPLNDGNNHIHGGRGTDTKVWSFRPYYRKKKVGVELTLVDYAGENGYPGNLKIQVNYTLDNDDKLEYRIKAWTDQMTLFNPTNHTYFNLDGPGKTIAGMFLQINSDYYLPLDQESLPYKGMKPVRGTAFDFSSPQRLGKVLKAVDSQIINERGLNHPFILNGKSPAVTLRSADDKCGLTLTTDAPAIVVYTANHFNHSGVADNLGQYDGIALEAQIPPQENDHLGPFVLLPGEKFKRLIDWQFTY